MKPLPGQQSLFGPARTGRDEYDAPPVSVPLNTSVPEHEAPRLGAQHAKILDRLREGPATNAELQAIAHRFGARLNELKLAGHGWTKRCIKPGIYEYRLD